MTLPRVRAFLRDKPWIVGALVALMPIGHLWYLYPVTWDSKVVSARVIDSRTSDESGIVNAGSQGAAQVTIYELNVITEFAVAGTNYRATGRLPGSSNKAVAEQLATKAKGVEIVAVYSASDPAKAFTFTSTDYSRARINIALSICFFVIGTWGTGRMVGRYKADQLNIPLSEISLAHAVAWSFPVLLVLGLFFF